jgi:hypothetical protein
MRSKHNLQGVRSIVSQIRSRIPRIIRSRKTIAIGFATSLILSQLYLSCLKADKSTHYVKTIGSCNQQTDIKIFDETGGSDLYGKPADTIGDKHFKNYVNTISKYIFTKIDKMGQCDNTSENPQVQLIFVYRPAISRGIAPYNDSVPTKSQDNRYLDSPWVKLALDKSPQHNVRGVFIWNERQFLLDQALIFGWRISDTKPLLTIDLETFDRWQESYRTGSQNKGANLFKQLPPDIQWLFKCGWIDDVQMGGTKTGMGSLDVAIKSKKSGYTNLTNVLVDLLFDSSKSDTRYDNILDLKDILNVYKYPIDSYEKSIILSNYKSLHDQGRI